MFGEKVKVIFISTLKVDSYLQEHLPKLKSGCLDTLCKRLFADTCEMRRHCGPDRHNYKDNPLSDKLPCSVEVRKQL